jgi:hypothetical protein
MFFLQAKKRRGKEAACRNANSSAQGVAVRTQAEVVVFGI